MIGTGHLKRIILLCALIPLGCAGTGPPPEAVPTPDTTPGSSQVFDRIQREIFDPNCLSAGCHNASTQAGDLNLTSSASYAQLVNVIPFHPDAAQAGLRRVLPFDPERSFILIKLTDPQDLGTRMPQGASPLSPAQIALIRSWIVAGAPPGSAGTPRPSTPTLTPTVAPTATQTSIPSSTATPTITATSTVSPTGTLPATATATQTPRPTATAVPSATHTPTPSPTFNPDATLQNIQDTIFTPSCLFLGCHSSADHQNDLVLESGMSFAELVGVVPFNEAARNAGLLRVDPGNPQNSFLLTKLTLTAFDRNFFSPMPLAPRPPLTTAQIQLIRDWIAQGAMGQ